MVRTQTLYWHQNLSDDKPRPTQLCLLRSTARMGAQTPAICLALYRWRQPDGGVGGYWVEQFDGEFTLPDDVVVEWAYAEEK